MSDVILHMTTRFTMNKETNKCNNLDVLKVLKNNTTGSTKML